MVYFTQLIPAYIARLNNRFQDKAFGGEIRSFPFHHICKCPAKLDSPQKNPRLIHRSSLMCSNISLLNIASVCHRKKAIFITLGKSKNSKWEPKQSWMLAYFLVFLKLFFFFFIFLNHSALACSLNAAKTEGNYISWLISRKKKSGSKSNRWVGVNLPHNDLKFWTPAHRGKKGRNLVTQTVKF